MLTCVELLPEGVPQISKRNSQNLGSYLRKTTGTDPLPSPSVARVKKRIFAEKLKLAPRCAVPENLHYEIFCKCCFLFLLIKHEVIAAKRSRRRRTPKTLASKDASFRNAMGWGVGVAATPYHWRRWQNMEHGRGLNIIGTILIPCLLDRFTLHFFFLRPCAKAFSHSTRCKTSTYKFIAL